MKHLQKYTHYKLFESDETDEDNDIPEGFEHSWDDVKEILYGLTDIGFEIIGYSTYYADKSGDKVSDVGSLSYRKSDKSIEDIKWGIYEVKLSKKTNVDKIHKQIDKGESYRSNYVNYYLDSDVDSIMNIYEEISSICGHFGKAYQNLTVEKESYDVWLMLATPIGDEFITDKTQQEKVNKSESAINSFFSHKRNDFIQWPEKNYWDKYSKRFKELAFQNKMGEYMSHFKGTVKSGFLVNFINDTKMTKTVKDINFGKIPKSSYEKYGIKTEFRRVTDADFERLSKIMDLDINHLKERYDGLMGVFYEFDYDKLFKQVQEMDPGDRAYLARGY